MTAGRKPLPSHLKMVRGTDRPDRTNKDEPKPEADKISPPVWLSGLALEHFTETAETLKAAGIMTNADIDALVLYCTSYANMREALDNIERERAIAETLIQDLEDLAEWDDDAKLELERVKGAGLVDKTRTGYRQQSVWVQIYNKSLEQMHKLGAEFGMTPSSRTRISTNKKPGDPEGWDDV